jgi:phosphomannomutase / phosphoglucomutase
MEEAAMPISPGIFREYDIRGIVGVDLDVTAAGRIGRAFGTYLRRADITLATVGHDNRLSSGDLYEAVIRGLNATGCNTLGIGLATSPMLYFSLYHFRSPGGVMVTASHNPPEFNGLKLAVGPGTLYGEQIQQIRTLAESGDFERGSGQAEPRELFPAYTAMLAERITLGPRRLRVVLDCGSGTASAFAPDTFRRWGCDLVPLYCQSDPTFPHHHPDPSDIRNLAALRRIVLETHADVGIGLDGDGDRIGVVDDRGSVLWPDLLMALFWREVLAAHPGAVALVEVKCSQALIDEIVRLGGRPEWTRTGHSLIKARMREVGAVFAGEMSGHIFFADEYYGYDDATYAAGRLLRMLSNSDRALSSLAAELPHYDSTPEIRVACPDDRKFAVVAAITEAFRKEYEVVDIDGARVIFADGWGLIRASNTQPVLVVRAEGKTPDAFARIEATLEAALRRFPEVAPVTW